MINEIRKSFVFKMALLFLVAALIPYLLVTMLFFQSSREALYGEIKKGLGAEIELVREALDAKLYLLRGNAVAWADLEVMGDILTDDIDKRIANVMEGLKRDYRIEGELYAVNTKGVVVASTSAEIVGQVIGGELLGETLGGSVVELDVHTSVADSIEVIGFSVPVRASFAGGYVIGALVLESELSEFGPLIEVVDMPHAGIFMRGGRPVATSGDWPFAKERFRDFALSEGVQDYGPGYIVSVSISKGYYDFRGFGWVVAAAIEKNQALAPARSVERTSIVAGVLGILLIVGLVALFASRGLRPLRELSKAADHIARTKDFDSVVLSRSSDEIGNLADSFNRMVGEVNTHLTHISTMEAEMRRADRLTALGELSAGMAHEIKNPLGMIKSSADMLRDKLGEESDEAVLGSVISEEAERLKDILDAFLEFARPRPPKLVTCSVNDIVERALALVGPEFGKAGVEVERRLDAALPVTRTDPDLLYQVFINIIMNAMQAMEEGGSLSVGTRVVAYEKFSTGREFIEIDISDTGKGIPPELKEKIFNPFFTTKEKGSGLGLSIVYRIVDGLGGVVEVENREPRGTSFRIFIPLLGEVRDEENSRS